MSDTIKYQPSNGTEGAWFTDEYCMNCLHCNPDPEGEKQCKILFMALSYNISEPEYPEEWIRDGDGNPKCTKFYRWDWDNDGDPDDPNNDKAPIIPAPNQLKLDI